MLTEELVLNTYYHNQDFRESYHSHIEPTYFSSDNPTIFEFLTTHYEEYGTMPSFSLIEHLPNVEFLREQINVTPEETRNITQTFITERYTKEVWREGVDLIDTARTQHDYQTIINNIEIPVFSDNYQSVTKFNDIRQLYMSDCENINTTLSTGFSCLDIDTNRFRKPSLVTYIAGSYVGKTNIMLNQAIQMSQTQQVAYIHFEMSAQQVRRRLYGILGNINIDNIEDIDPHQVQSRLPDSNPNFTQITMDTGSTAQDIKRKIRGLGLDVVFVDYIAYMEPLRGSNRDSSYTSQSNICIDLIQLAKDEDLCVVTAAQLNRDGNEKNIEDISRNHLADCIDVFNKSDVCIALSCKSLLTEGLEGGMDGRIFYKLLKNRNGSIEHDSSTNKFGHLFFNNKTMKMYDAAENNIYLNDIATILQNNGRVDQWVS